jgi:hypothetical protein
VKHDWTDGTKECWSRLFVYAIVLPVLTRIVLVIFQKPVLYVLYFKD